MEQSKGAKPASSGQANIRYSVYQEPGQFAGKTIAEVRAMRKDLWNIPADASAYVGREKVTDSYIIQPGDQVDFSKRMGEKG